MLTVSIVLAILALVAAVFGFGLLHAPVIGPARMIFYFSIFLAVAILAVDLLQQQQAEVNPVIQPVVE